MGMGGVSGRSVEMGLPRVLQVSPGRQRVPHPCRTGEEGPGEVRPHGEGQSRLPPRLCQLLAPSHPNELQASWSPSVQPAGPQCRLQ